MTRPALALAAIVLAGTIAYGALGAQLRGPSVFADELIYMDATRSIAGGHRPIERDRPYGRGLLYPIAAAPVFALTQNDLDGYRALKLFNAFLFALTAIPAFFLARRLVGTSWSLVVAAAAIALPSALYSGLVVTENIAYLTGSLALLAVALALERPTWGRQLTALGTVALAALARPQLGALAIAFLLALGVRFVLGCDFSFRRLWPTAVAIGAVALVVAAAFASGHASLRDYRDVWTSYDALSVVKWSWYTLGDLALYLAFVPIVVAPAMLLDAVRRGRGRDGNPRDAAFVGLFLAANLLTILIVAAFSSASFGFERLHDRYLFYVIPLWLVLLAAWVERGARVSARTLAAGSALAIGLVATMPNRLFVHDGAVQFDAVATAIWSRIRDLNVERTTAFRLVLVAAAVTGLVTATGAVVVSRRWRWLVLAPIAAVFAANAAIVWKARIADADRDVFPDNRPQTWSWVDAAVPKNGNVADLFVDSGPCLAFLDALRWTEFFNGRIGPVYRIGLPAPPGVITDGTNTTVSRDGTLRTADGRSLRPQFVVAEPGLVVRGHRVARGTETQLALWKVDQPLRVERAPSNAAVVGSACKGAHA